jgi:cobaltochelatase CobN
VYFDDAHKLGLPQFLGQGHNAHVKAHMLAIFMVAAEKGFWQTDAATIKKMGGELARLVAKNGLPGSGHTAPNHPMWQWLAPQLDAADAQALGVTLAKARGDVAPAAYTAPAGAPSQPTARQAEAANAPAAQVEAEAAPPARYYELQPVADNTTMAQRTLHILALLATTLALFGFGLWRGRQGPPLISGETHV